MGGWTGEGKDGIIWDGTITARNINAGIFQGTELNLSGDYPKITIFNGNLSTTNLFRIGRNVNEMLHINVDDNNLYTTYYQDLDESQAHHWYFNLEGSATMSTFDYIWQIDSATEMTLNQTGLTVSGTGTFSGLTSGRVTFAGTGGLLSDSANLTFTSPTLSINAGTGNTNNNQGLKVTKGGHSSAYSSAVSVVDENARETVGFTSWSGGGGTGGYGAILGSSYCNGTALRLCEIGGKNTYNGYRLADWIFETSTAADKGRAILLLGSGGGGFAYSMWCAENGIGIGTSSAPTARLHLAAGAAAASGACLKLTTGSTLTAAEAGAVEFASDRLYFTITTGTARKEVVLNDGTNLTATRVPFCTTNGRLTDASGFTFDSSIANLATNGYSIGANQVIDASRVANFVSLQIGGTEIIDSSRNIKLGGSTILDASGYFRPLSSSDASAPNNSIYLSTDTSTLVYKDSAGNVTDLI